MPEVQRVAAAKKAIESVGDTLESYYFSFGGHDAVVLADLPDNASAAAALLVVGASGAGSDGLRAQGEQS